MIPDGAMAFAELPQRRRAGRSRRGTYHRPRPRKLSPEQAAAIRCGAGSGFLRERAAEFGVSHETVRGVLRPRPAVAGAAGC